MIMADKYIVSIEIDSLTDSIRNSISGDSFRTEVRRVNENDLKIISKKNGWKFNWGNEFKLKDRAVFKLIIEKNPSVVQGVVSISDFQDHFFLHLIESAPFNQGKRKLYEGVPGNLIAFACKQSFEKGYMGFLAFISKTRLIEHYEKTLGAIHVGGQRMIIYPDNSIKLIRKYFPKL